MAGHEVTRRPSGPQDMVQGEAQNPEQYVRQQLRAYHKQLQALVPKQENINRLGVIALNQYREVPDLYKCDPSQVLACIVKSLELGVSLGKATGEAFIIPFKNVPTFVLGVPGRVKLMYQSGFVRQVRTGNIYEGQVIRADTVKGELELHEEPEDADGTKTIGWFAAVELTTGGWAMKWMYRKEMERRRMSMPSKNSPAWRDHYNEMAQNVVLRWLSKRVPRSAQMALADFFDGGTARMSREPGVVEVQSEYEQLSSGTPAEDVVVDQPAAPAEEPPPAEQGNLGWGRSSGDPEPGVVD